jgi:antitoxin (DNA-binding transcriptional repressor) of toxin-antitoxin stability system
MMTISVSDLKSHLSAELKKVQDGAVLTVLDHRHPIARLVPLEGKDLVLREPAEKYSYDIQMNRCALALGFFAPLLLE